MKRKDYAFLRHFLSFCVIFSLCRPACPRVGVLFSHALLCVPCYSDTIHAWQLSPFAYLTLSMY